jgi:ribosomal protein S21
MAINVEVNKNNNESGASVLRRFTRKIQGSGVLPKVRSLRYAERKLSHYKVKKATLKSLTRKTEVARLIKLGKMPDRMGSHK